MRRSMRTAPAQHADDRGIERQRNHDPELAERRKPDRKASGKPLSGCIASAATITIISMLTTNCAVSATTDVIAGAMRQHHEDGEAEPRAEHRRRGEHDARI